jgi:hypothetical protein
MFYLFVSILIFCLYMAITTSIKDVKEGKCLIHKWEKIGSIKVGYRNEYGTKLYDYIDKYQCKKCGERG